MISMLRSRIMLYLLVGLLVFGLVVTGAIGLFQSFNQPPAAGPEEEFGPGQGQEGQGQEGPQAPEGEEQEPPPEVEALGTPPSGYTYVDQDEAHCAEGYCFRLILVADEEGEELDAGPEESVEAVYEHLLAHGWSQDLPEDEDSPDDVALTDSVLTDGTTLVADSSAPEADALPVLMLGNAGDQPAN
ncbi:hypothetical protein [Nocardiopsis nanhaiensis]